MDALKATGLAHAYGKGAARTDVLKDFGLALAPGAFEALMGPSGSGKSTFLHLAAGLIAPSAGRIEIGGTDVTALSDSAAGRIQMAGPVFFRRFTGSYQDQKVKIEVWEIPGAASGEKSLLTELSLESEDVEHAALLREALTEQLKKLGVFVDQDGLKTQKVLDHYFGAELEAGHE